MIIPPAQTQPLDRWRQAVAGVGVGRVGAAHEILGAELDLQADILGRAAAAADLDVAGHATRGRIALAARQEPLDVLECHGGSEGGLRSDPVTSGWNFADVYEVVAEQVPDAPCQVQGERRITWGEFDRRADGIAKVLLDNGAQRHDKLAHYLYSILCGEVQNRTDWLGRSSEIRYNQSRRI